VLRSLAEEKAQAAAAIIAPTLIDVSDIALGDILGEGSNLFPPSTIIPHTPLISVER
jgi:hypothetical protein